MDQERIEELLRKRPPQERTYDRPLPDFSRRPQRLTFSVGTRGRSPVAGTPWALAFVVAGVVGVGLSGLWLAAAFSPTAPAAAQIAAHGSSRTSSTFSLTGSLITARADHTATALPDGRVLIAGGVDLAGPLATAELYDPKTGTFSPTGSLITARYNQTATLLSDGRVLVVGGAINSGPLASAELYDPKTGTFSATGSLVAARAYQTATALADGRVLVTGGVDLSGPLASAELYDPKTGTFSPTGSLITARVYQTATALPNGRVLIAGGVGTCPASSCRGLATAELYDPKTGTFNPTGSLTTARGFQTATALSDGRVLIAGGASDFPASEPFASAELYQP